MRLTRLVADLRDLSLAEVHQLELHKSRWISTACFSGLQPC